MARSQLIARLARRGEAFPRGDVEVAVKTMLEYMTGCQRRSESAREWPG